MAKERDEAGDQALEQAGSWKRLARLFAYTRPHPGRLVFAIAALFIAAGLGLAYPRFFGEAIDAAFTDRNLGELDRTASILVVIFAGQSLFVFIRHYLMSWLGERVVADLRIEVFEHLLRLPQSYFHRHRTGELLSRLSDDVTRLQDVVGQDLSMALRNIVTLIGGIGILFWLNPLLTGAMLAVVPPLVVGASLWGRIIRRLSRAAHDALAGASGGLQEGLAGVETVQAFTREEFELNRYRDAIGGAFDLLVKRIRARSWFMSVSSFLAFSTIAGIFWLGGRSVVRGEITAGELNQFFFYTMFVAGAVASLAGLVGSYQ